MELLIILLLLILNGIFAMYEIALVSSRRSRLQEKAGFVNQGAKKALILLEKPERILSAIQVGITLIGIIAGAYGGVAIADDFEPLLRKIGFLREYSEPLSVILIVGAITYFSVIIGELVPKTLALNNPEPIAILLSPVMFVFGKTVHPLIWILSASTKLVLKIFRIKPVVTPPVTEDELKILLKQSSEFGVIEKEESLIISEVFRFGEKRVNTIMTPRVDVFWIDLNDELPASVAEALNSGFSRFPVAQGDIDNIKGLVSIKDILLLEKEGGDKANLLSVVSEPLFIPERMTAVKVLEIFRNTKKHFGFVVNEFGSIEGIATLHDVVENIIGDLPEQNDQVENMVFVRDDGTYLIDGSIPVDDLKDVLRIQNLFGEEETDSFITTLGGLMMHLLDKVPATGDKLIHLGYSFEIVDMDGNRVDKVLVAKL
jgi:putative hemolysin